MAVGTGLGSLLPFVPGGQLLRSILTERLAGVHIAFSTGVFLLEGMLDGLGPAILVGYLLAAVALSAWTRGLLIVVLVQAVISLLVPLLLRARRHRPFWERGSSGRLAKLFQLGHQVEQGVTVVLTRGRSVALSIVGLSLLVTALCTVQSALLLRAFGLGVSINGLLLISVLLITAGTLPVNVPGAGTVATAAALRAAGIHGAGVAGYVLISRLVFAGWAAVPALALVGWWGATGHWRTLGLGTLLSCLRGRMRSLPSSHRVE
jgi:hypothetical protein